MPSIQDTTITHALQASCERIVTLFCSMSTLDKPKTLAWLAEHVLRQQLSGIHTADGRSFLAYAWLRVMSANCSVQHWFGVQHANTNEEQLLKDLEAARPADLLPAAIQHDYPWSNEDIHTAAAAMPALTPMLYCLFHVFGDCAVRNFESRSVPAVAGAFRQYKHAYRELVIVPEVSLRPALTNVLLRTTVLAAKILSLILCKDTSPLGINNLACECLRALAVMITRDCAKCVQSNVPPRLENVANTTFCQEQALCELLLKTMLPMLHQASQLTDPAFAFTQQATAASQVLMSLLQHSKPTLTKKLADSLLAFGRCLY